MLLYVIVSSLTGDRLVGLVVKESPSRVADLGWIPAFSMGLLCHAPGIIGSALGLVGPVSVYYDWVR